MKIVSLFMILFLLAGCEFFGASGDSDGGNGGDRNSESSNYSIIGNVQKGPFIIGSNVTIQALNSSLIPTGQTFSTQTTDNFGSFSLALELGSRYVEIMVSGYYYNEVSGELSDSTLTLRSVSDLEQGKTININILTALQAQRLTKLVQAGSTFEAAQEQSLTELLDVFNIPSNGVLNFDKMDITGSSTSDGILLAVSSVMQQDSSVAELSSELSTITTDIASDGVLDNSSVKDSILTSSYNLHMLDVETNLKNRYEELGQAYTVPESFRDFIDSDGDGVINVNDTEEYGVEVFDYVCGRTEQIKDQLESITGKSCHHLTSSDDLKDIEFLSLWDIGITSLKAGDFDGLTGVTVLDFRRNQISTIEPGTFNGLSSLEGLYVSQNQLTDLPEGIFDELSSLELLWLWGNQITDLPEGIFDELSSLELLDLGENQISTLPEGIFDELSSLTTLGLFSNKLPQAEIDRITNEINALGGVSLHIYNQVPD